MEQKLNSSKIKLNFERYIFSKTSICKSFKNIYNAEKLRGAKWRPSATPRHATPVKGIFTSKN